MVQKRSVSIAVLLLEGPLIHKAITMRRLEGIQFILRKNLDEELAPSV
jgi:hypothetical protein